MARSFVFHIRPGLEIVPGYELIKLLGDGAFGEVWESTAPGGGRAALKLIDLRDQMGVREYVGLRRVQNVRHANLVDVNAMFLINEDGSVLGDDEVAAFDARTIPSGATLAAPRSGPEPAMLVMAMSKAEKNLRKRLEECLEEFGTGIPEKELLGYMDQAARGIDHLNAAKHNIQHCDIKPENLVLFGDSVKICDFGIAKLVDNWAQTATEFPGTLYYMAPEMHESPPQPNSHTDQYSFACMYYLLRTSKLPFNDESSIRAITTAHCEGKLDLSEIQGKHETKVIRRATQLVPERRFGSAGEFVEALKEAIWNDGREAIEARRKARNRRIRLGILGVLAAAVVGLMIYCRGPIISTVTKAGSSVASFASDFFKQPDALSEDPQSFEDAIKIAERLFSEGVWKGAFDECRALMAKDEYADDAEKKFDTFVQTLIEQANGNLDDKRAQAIAQYDAVWSQLKDRRNDKAKNAAIVGLARAAARDGRWSDVADQIEKLPEVPSVPRDDQEYLALVLSVLHQISQDPAKFFDVLDQCVVLVEAEKDLPSIRWERRQFRDASIKALELLLSDQYSAMAEDPRFTRIFGDDLVLWKSLLKAANELLATKAPTPERLAELQNDLQVKEKEVGKLYQDLEEPENQAVKQGQEVAEYIKYLSFVARARDHDKDLGAIWEALPTDDMSFDRAKILCEFLWEHLETKALHAMLGADEIPSAVTYLKKMNVLGRAATTFDQNLRAIETIQSVHGGSFDPTKALAICESLRRPDLTLSPNVETMINAIRAECLFIAKDARRPPAAAKLKEAKRFVEAISVEIPFPASSSYLKFVRARILGGDVPNDSVQLIKETLQPTEMPAYYLFEARRNLAAEILVDAARDLQSQPDDQIHSDAFRQVAAERAKGLIQLARERLKHNNTSSQRLYALATYYAGGDSNSHHVTVTEICSILDPKPTEAEDGQLLLISAMAHYKLLNSMSDDDPDKTLGVNRGIRAFSQLIEWCGDEFDRFEEKEEWSKFHRDVVMHAKTISEFYENQITNLKSDVDPPDVTRIPKDLRLFLARIWGASASLVQNDDRVEKDNFPNQHAEAVKHSYFYFRAANVLSGGQIQYVMGQCKAVLELRDYPDDKRFVESDKLAKKALVIDPDHAIANMIRGRMLLARSRSRSKQARQKDLGDAIAMLNKAIRSLQQARFEAECLVYRSNANLEIAFLVESTRDKRDNLDKALQDAEDAKAIDFRSKKQHAFLAAGNAAEDLAYYVRKDPEKNYEQAISDFQQAAVECERNGQPAAKARLSKGRCRFRRAAAIFDSKIDVKSLNIDSVDSELETCIAELESVEKNSPTNSEKAKSFFWLSRVHELRAKVTEKPSHYDLAEKELEKATKLADRNQWVQMQITWANLAGRRSHTENELKRWQAILDAQGEEKYAVNGKHLYWAASRILKLTDSKVRSVKFDVLLEYFQEGTEDFLPHRINLRLYFAELILPSEELTSASQKVVDSAYQHAAIAWNSAKSLPEVEIVETCSLSPTHFMRVQSNAAATLALATYAQYHKVKKDEKKKTELLTTLALRAEEASDKMPAVLTGIELRRQFKTHKYLSEVVAHLWPEKEDRIKATIRRLQKYKDRVSEKDQPFVQEYIDPLNELLP